MISVNTPIKIYRKHGFVHIDQICKEKGCEYLDMPGQDGYCSKHYIPKKNVDFAVGGEK